MFGCLGRIGCAIVLLILGVGLFLTRGRWMPSKKDTIASSTAVIWEPITPGAADRGKRAVESLSGKGGRVYASLTAGELASYAFTSFSKNLPPSARDVRASVIGDRLYVKAVVNLADLGGSRSLGALGDFLGDRDSVRFGGELRVVKPGLAEFRLRDIRIGALSIPPAMIPKIAGKIRRDSTQLSTENGLPLDIPPYISDVRIAGGKITLYKNTP